MEIMVEVVSLSPNWAKISASGSDTHFLTPDHPKTTGLEPIQPGGIAWRRHPQKQLEWIMDLPKHTSLQNHTTSLERYCVRAHNFAADCSVGSRHMAVSYALNIWGGFV